MKSDEWVENIYDYQVEIDEITRPGDRPYLPNQATSKGVLHTTEGSTIASAFSTLNAKKIAPHFIIGQGRIVQTRPLNAQASALRDPGNRDARIQIEMVGFSKQTLWLPEPATLEPTIALLAWCNEWLLIPLVVPNNWPDDVSDMKGQVWAANNRRRKQAAAGLWPKAQGWWMHLEIPLQGPSWHWDCGALRRSEMLKAAQALVDARRSPAITPE